MPTKARNIELLNKQIAAAKDGHPDDIAEWQLGTEIALRHTVGEGSPALKAFRAISFGWIGPPEPTDQTQKRQRDAVIGAIACLKSAIAELDLQDHMSKTKKVDVLNRQIEAANDVHLDDIAEWQLRTETVLRSTVGEKRSAVTRFPAARYSRPTPGGEDSADLQRDGLLQAVGNLKSAISDLGLLDEDPSAQLAAEQSGGDILQPTFAELVEDLNGRRRNGEKPPVLLLGAGASLAAGIPTMSKLFDRFGCNDFEEFSRYIGPRSDAERYRYLAEVLQAPAFDEITAGYQALAALLADAYFDLVLTTNMDPLLEDALSAARLRRRDYVLLVNGLMRPKRMELPLLEPNPRVKVVKLHGDLFSRCMAWTADEMNTFLSGSWRYLKDAVAGRDFIVIGYSLHDRKVVDLVKSPGRSVWFLHHKKVPDDLRDINKEIKFFRAVVGPQCAFEAFFPALAKTWKVTVPTRSLDAAKPELSLAAPVDAGAQTIDDLMSATFGIEGPGGTWSSTAFLIAEPRVILCDRYASGLNIVDGVANLIDSNGSSFSARVIAVNSNYPFGPTVLEAPTHLLGPGLRLATGVLQVSDEVQILVAVGAATGISSGKVTARGLSISITPVGEVEDLVEVHGLIAPGASGAPVVDSTLSVCGFVVGGGTDTQDPRALAYPAEHWAPFVLQSSPGRPAESAGSKDTT
jgi:hypothetical protein